MEYKQNKNVQANSSLSRDKLTQGNGITTLGKLFSKGHRAGLNLKEKVVENDTIIKCMLLSVGGTYGHDKSLGSLGPLVPAWLLSPCKITNQVLSHLYCVEQAYFARYISYNTYDQWMMLNTGKYQLGSNDELLSLWNERKEFSGFKSSNLTNRDLIDIALIKGRQIRLRSKGLPIVQKKEGLDHLLSLNFVGFSVKKCQRGGMHVKLACKNNISRNHLKPLNMLFPWLEFEDKQKTNLDLASLVFAAVKRGKISDVQKALDLVSIGSANTIITGIVIAALGNFAWPKMAYLMQKDKMCCVTDTSRKAYFKACSTAMRRTARLPDGMGLSVEEVAALAYFELSTGRAGNLTNWDEEKAKRCGPILPLIDPVAGDDLIPKIKQTLSSIIKEILPVKDVWGTWSDFIMSRQRWSPAGSAGGYKMRMDNETIRLNKHSYFELEPTSIVMDWIDSEPKLEARGSEKMESGKARAIYGTAPQDQAITTYVIGPLERQMGNVKGLINGHMGVHEVADVGARISKVSGYMVECAMVDFADFNYQHTLSAQQLLYQVIEEELSIYSNTDLNKAVKWCVNAQLNQWVRFPEDERWYRVTQGMFSGSRHTDFMNTLLNISYFTAAFKLVEEYTNLKPVELYNLHKGDDVWISNASRLWAATVYHFMAEAGFVFQNSKQMFDVNRGEFLRVLYSSGIARGYLMRSVATLLIKPIQSVLEMSPQGKATALTSQINLLYRRGLSKEACEILWWSLIPHALKVKLPGGSGVSIPVGIAMKPFKLGGLDIGPPGTVGVGLSVTAPVPAPMPYTKELEAAIPTHMSHDWIIEVSKKVGKPFKAEKLQEVLHASNVCDSLRPRDRLLSMRRLEKEIKRWKDGIRIETRTDGKRVEMMWARPVDGVQREIGKRLELALQAYIASGSEPGGDYHIVDTIIAGIAASPFRDLSSAKLALGTSNIDAARTCFQLAVEKSVARKGSAILESLILKYGVDITTCILQGIRGVGISYEAWVNPIVLSMISKKATDCAILSGDNTFIQSRYNWYEWLDGWMHGLLCEMVIMYKLDAWSHY